MNKYNFDLTRPIPEGKPMDGWRNNVIDEANPAFNEPIVPVEVASNGVYYGERESAYEAGELDGSLLTSFVREGVAKKLVEASKLLPPRCVLMTLDTLRTEEVQNSLFQNFKKDLLKPPFNMTEEVAVEKTQQYVSLPSKPNSPHLTGGAVDLTIVEFNNDTTWKRYQTLTRKLKKIERDGKHNDKIEEIERERGQLLREQAYMLNMGVAFDQVALDEKGRDKTALRYYEIKLAEDGIKSFSKNDKEAIKNRRMLYNVMTAVGFTAYPDEPWHFDYGNKFWAQQSGKTAFYGYAEPSAENMAHEEMRRERLAAELFVQDEYQAPEYSEEVKLATNRIGNPQYSTRPHLAAHVIKPAKPAPTNG